MKPETEDVLLGVLWGVEFLLFPSLNKLATGRSGWPQRRLYADRLRKLEHRGLLKREKRAAGLVYQLTEAGRLRIWGGRDPASQWQRAWDGKWRLVVFDLPLGQQKIRKQLLRWLRLNGFGYLQDSVWLSPDPIEGLTAALNDFREDVELLTLLEARCLGLRDAAPLVKASWKFDQINQRYRDYLNFLETAKPTLPKLNPPDTLAWLQQERRRWRDAVVFDPLLPRVLWPPGYLGEQAWTGRLGLLSTTQRRLTTR